MGRCDEAVSELLRFSARIECEHADSVRLGAIAQRVQHWDEVPAAAEAHGLAPLLRFHLRTAAIPVPPAVSRQLVALTIRHRHANEVRSRVLAEILDAFDGAGIPVIVLKGAALAYILYPSAGLRPMNDLDLLVDGDVTGRAQHLLQDLGFSAPHIPANVRLIGHHHLPPATRETEGMTVQVEIHHDALSRDSPASLTMRDLTDLPRPFSVSGRVARTLGHHDMLHHLSRHCAERGPLLRLIWVADLAGYARRYREMIDWTRLRREHPFVLNALSLVHCVSPLPASIVRSLPPLAATPPPGVGESCKPLETILRPGRTFRGRCRDVLYPSDWWLRLYYGVNATTPLFWCRWFRHPYHVVRGGLRRAGVYARWRGGLTR